jgi:hypothetical protein
MVSSFRHQNIRRIVRIRVGYLQKGLKPFYEILRKIRKTNNFLWDDSIVKLF